MTQLLVKITGVDLSDEQVEQISYAIEDEVREVVDSEFENVDSANMTVQALVGVTE